MNSNIALVSDWPANSLGLVAEKANKVFFFVLARSSARTTNGIAIKHQKKAKARGQGHINSSQ
jgi:hypothetical protein